MNGMQVMKVSQSEQICKPLRAGWSDQKQLLQQHL